MPKLKALGILCFTVLLILPPICASAQKRSGKKAAPKSASANRSASGVDATVVIDGAIVYVSPDVDSSIITQLPLGRKVRVSKGTTSGTERFRKIRVWDRIGFISDIDVRVEGAGSAKTVEKDPLAAPPRKKPAKKARAADEHRKPFYFSRYVGALLGVSEFKESIDGIAASDNLAIYGLKLTGPDVLIDGPVLDVNLALHYGAPSYYETLSQTKPSGFVLWTDVLVMIPVVNRDNWMMVVEAGPTLSLSQFTVVQNSRTMDLSQLNAGLTLAFGGALRIGRVALRLDGKYTIEKTQYKAIQLALQSEF